MLLKDKLAIVVATVTIVSLGYMLMHPKQKATVQYSEYLVGRSTIAVEVNAAGSAEPLLTVNVKTKAAGQVLQTFVETGTVVHVGDTLVRIDTRDPLNTYRQALADSEVAQATYNNTLAQKTRTDTMFIMGLASEQEKDAATLSYAQAQSQLVRARAALQLDRDALTDCDVISPVDGTVIQKMVEVGTVITSASSVSGGTTIMTIANLDTIQVRAMVDEVDIGKVSPGMRATITFDAFPNQEVDGVVSKIEPQATVNQDVTMFAALIVILNPNHMFSPGMNSDVVIHVAEEQNVLAIPDEVIRTRKDATTEAAVLGLDTNSIRHILANDTTKSNHVVFVRRGDSIVPVVIYTSLDNEDSVVVRSGLSIGDTVVYN